MSGARAYCSMRVPVRLLQRAPMSPPVRLNESAVSVLVKLVREHELTPDVIISSDADRARLTAVAEAAGCADVRFEGLSTPRARPTSAPCCAQLTGEQPDLPTAALAQTVLSIDGWRDLKESTRGRLLGLWRPKERA